MGSTSHFYFALGNNPCYILTATINNLELPWLFVPSFENMHEPWAGSSVRSVVLFGSYARGKATEDSDVDILVIMDHDKPRNVDQAIAIRLIADTPFPLDLLVRRPAEVDERLAMNDTFIRSILEDGEVLYE